MKKNNYRVPVLLFIVLFMLLLPSLAAKVAATGDYAEQIRIIEHFVKVNMENFKIPGLAIGFYKDDFTWAKGFGYSDLENRVPVTPGTLFRMASVTKPMTAVGIVKLAEDGKLNLNDPVEKHVPYFPEKKWPVTIRHLLGHLGGISHYRNEDVEGHLKTHHNTRQAIDIFKDWKLEAEPGTRFIYSSYGYNLLGAVIEGASGQSFARYMTENIWKPLSMNHTRMDIADEIIPNRTRGYRVVDGSIKNCEFVDISSRFGAGGTLASVTDMLNFAHGLDRGRVLSMQAQKQMYDSMETKNRRLTEYGMGWRVDFLSGFWNVSHGGGQAGTSTFLLRFPGENFAVAVATNLQEHNTQKYAALIRRVVLGAFHVRVETPGVDEDEFLKLHIVWHVGLGYLSRFNKTFTEKDEELVESFAYFNTIDAKDKKARQKIVDGLFPSTGSPLFKIGTYMAQRLGQTYGIEKLDHYRRMGAIPFFAGYIDLYKKDASIPGEYRFTKKTEKLVSRWNKSWGKTWTKTVKDAFLLPLTELGGKKEQLKKLFKGQSAYPLLDLTGHARELRTSGNPGKARDVLRAGMEIYPKNTDMYYTFGEFCLDNGENHKALEIFEKAQRIDKNKQIAKWYVAWARDLLRVAEKPVVLPAPDLQKFTGDYGPRHITYEEGSLYYQRDGGKKFRLIPLGEDRFALAGLSYFRIWFNVDKDGRVSKITGRYINGRVDESPRDPAAKK
jgi:CubicO group peptidase (beta-lactamase class C family)/tetratricopeptide (TPR) repeat protein